MKKKKVNTPVPVQEDQVAEEKPSSDNSNTVYDIPIFSEEFLNFNKARESELRYLRKTVTDQEQEVSVLDKHIENMNNGITKLTTNTEQLKEGCTIYEQYLNKLRHKLLDAFVNMALQNDTEPPTIETIDKYMINLATLISTSTDPSLTASIKKAVSNLDFSTF